MKYILFSVCFMFGGVLFSQTSKKLLPQIEYSNEKCYNINFELKNFVPSESNMDVINSVDLKNLEHLRKKNQDVEYFDAAIGYTIILYSLDKSLMNLDELILGETN